MAGIFADEAITGTKIDKREGFQEMMGGGLSVHLGWQCDNVRASYDEIPKATQDTSIVGLCSMDFNAILLNIGW